MDYPTRQEVKDDVERCTAQIHSKVSVNAEADGYTLELKKSWFVCVGCKMGLNGTLAGVIAVAIAGFPEDTGAIAAIASACGLPESVVIGILSGGGVGVEEAINELCKAMKAC